jgi:cell wall-associated NlpC family hydrolase
MIPLVIGAIAIIFTVMVAAIAGVLATGENSNGMCGVAQPATNENSASIPESYLRLYQAAGRRYGIPWPVLAGIGKVETDHGRNISTSPAGAAGPMQFMPATWNAYGIDGDGDGRKNINNPADSIFAAANYLHASGAPRRTRQALFAYNHSQRYVAKVLDNAHRFSAGADATDGCMVTGLVVAPNQIASTVIAYARAQLGKPYIYGGIGPRGFDCSGLTMMAYRAAGITIPRTSDAQYWWGPRIPDGHEVPGDLVFFDYKPGHSGPGHVGIVYDVQHGLMLVAPHTGTHVRIQDYRHHPGRAGFTRPWAHPVAGLSSFRHLSVSSGGEQRGIQLVGLVALIVVCSQDQQGCGRGRSSYTCRLFGWLI